MRPVFYRLFWQRFLSPGWRAGLFLVLLWSIPRFGLVLWANQTGSYQYVSLIFLTMWLAPFILLSRQGRQNIGIRWPRNYGWLLIGFLSGLAFCALLSGFAYFNVGMNYFIFYHVL